MPEHEAYRVRAITRAFRVLSTFDEDRPALTLDDLQQELGFNKASLLRILRTLEAEGALVVREGRYALGPRLLRLAHQFLSQTSLPRVAQPHFERLTQEQGLTVSLAILDGSDVVYLAVENPKLELGLQADIGKRHPAHATAVGKVLLASLPEEEARAILTAQPLEALTENTLVDPDAVMRELETVRARQYAVDDEERGIGIRCVAVPIVGARGRIQAAMSLAGPIFYCLRDRIDAYVEALRNASSAISYELGVTPDPEPTPK